MDQAGMLRMAYEHAGLRQRSRIERALVPQRIVLRGVDPCRRQPGKIRGAQRRDAGIVGREPLDTIKFPITRHRRFIDEITVRQFMPGRRASERVQRRTEQELQRQRDTRPPGVARRACREIAAGGVAADPEAARIDRPTRGTGGYRQHGGERVLVRGGKTRFRREPIVNRDHPAIRETGQDGAERVMCVEIAGDQAAAMKINQPGKFGCSQSWRGVGPHRYRPAVSPYLILAPIDGRRGRGEADERGGGGADVDEFRRTGARACHRVQLVEKAARRRVERQGESFRGSARTQPLDQGFDGSGRFEIGGRQFRVGNGQIKFGLDREH